MAKKKATRAEDAPAEAPPSGAPNKAETVAVVAVPAKPKRKGGISSWLNMSSLATVAMVGYVVFAGRNFSEFLDPLATLPEEYFQGPMVSPLWPEHTNISVEVAISTLPELRPDFMRNESDYAATTTIVWRESGVALSTNGSLERSISLLLVDADSAETAPATVSSDQSGSIIASLFFGEADGPQTRVLLPPLAWEQLRANKTLYMHAAIYTDGPAAWKGLADVDVKRTARLPTVTLVKYEPPVAGYLGQAKRKLLGDFGGPLGAWLSKLGAAAPWAPTPPAPGLHVAKWKPEAAVRIVAEFRDWPAVLQLHGFHRLRQRQPGGGVREFYAPSTLADEIGLTSDKYHVLNSTVNALPLKLVFSPLSFARWQLIARMEDGLKSQQRDFGFSDTDVDDVRRLISDTQTWLLAVTMLASALHLLFEFLAFKSDIEFWRDNKTLHGLSARAIVVDFVSQCVILAYLVDEGASLLVSLPSAGGILVQAWKVQKATGLTFDRATGRIRCLRLEAPSEADRLADPRAFELARVTQQTDRVATVYLTATLAPLVVGWAAKSLLYDAHRGWYSWALSSATSKAASAAKDASGVYTFGFILMTPQLVLNHRLKSVSHLPWKLLGFRFVNTFIDDLFAFVIKMPTMHRVSCFRDDFVFFIYLYQRWVYPVDAQRGTANEDCAH